MTTNTSSTPFTSQKLVIEYSGWFIEREAALIVSGAGPRPRPGPGSGPCECAASREGQGQDQAQGHEKLNKMKKILATIGLIICIYLILRGVFDIGLTLF